MRLDRVLDVATRFSGARLRCTEFVPLNYSWGKEVSITDDGENLKSCILGTRPESHGLQQHKTKKWLLDKYHPRQNEVEQ